MIVAQLQQIQQQQNQIGAEIQSINQFLQQQQRNMAELEELRRRYRQNGYDAYNSSFPGDFALGSPAGPALGGPDEFGHGLAGARPPPAAARPIFRRLGGFGGGSGDSGGDTGSFGGGGFRTGGGF